MWAYAQTSSQAAAIPVGRGERSRDQDDRRPGPARAGTRADDRTVALARGPGVDRRHGRAEARRSLSQTRGALAQLLGVSNDARHGSRWTLHRGGSLASFAAVGRGRDSNPRPSGYEPDEPRLSADRRFAGLGTNGHWQGNLVRLGYGERHDQAAQPQTTQGLFAMELAGLEPATSWGRSRRPNAQIWLICR